MRSLYAFTGALLGAVIHLAIHLLAAAIEHRPVGTQVLEQSMGWLIGLIVGGLLLGLWLGASIELHPQGRTPTPKAPVPHRAVQSLHMTRLHALLSYGRLRGQGIALTDIVLWGSVLDIDTRQ